MDNKVLLKQVIAAAESQDQLVFVYESKDHGTVVRFVTPIEIDGDTVLCHQHLPETGFRKFNLSKIKKFNRVVARQVFDPIQADAQVPAASSAE